LRHTKTLLIGAGTLAAGALAYANRVEPALIAVQEVHVALEGLDPAFDGYQIAQISDIHMNGSMTRARLQRVIDLINQQSPDLVVVTGDFATHKRTLDVDDLIAPLSALAAKDGKIAILGNHDYRTARAAIRHVIRASGLIPLNNAVHTLWRGAAALHIGGVESVSRHRARLDLVLNALPPSGAAILLAHEPDFAEVAAATKRFGLQLSGHSHGGQIRLPVLTQWALPSFSQRYVMGMYRVGKMLLYVNRGLGTVGAPLRFNCPPEITLFRLTAGTSN
jgi:predicted MPP superfamily phosphohydrolase